MDLILTPDNPVPPGAVVSAARTIDGLSIRVARWHPPGVPRGAVVLAQGRAEFIEKYFETVGDLLARGFAVVTFDWRGQGLSARQVENPRKGHVDDFLIYERDLDAVVEQAVAPFCPKPWFALAHSTGAAILLAQARRGRSPFARIVMTSPLIDIAGLPFPEGARMLADLLNVVGLGGAFVPGGKASSLLALPFAGNKLTSDERRYRRNADVAAAEPRVAIGAPTIGWLNAAFRRIEEFADPEYPSRVATPILIVAAGGDRVVSTPATERFGSRLKAGSVLVLEHCGHEILQERDALRERFWAAFDAFVPGSGEEELLGRVNLRAR